MAYKKINREGSVYQLEGIEDLWFYDCPDCGEPRKTILTYCLNCYNKKPKCPLCHRVLDYPIKEGKTDEEIVSECLENMQKSKIKKTIISLGRSR